MNYMPLLVQTNAGDFIDKTSIDRRTILCGAACFTAVSATSNMFVREGNTDLMLMYVSQRWQRILMYNV